MAFLRFAKATVVHPRVSGKSWKKVRTASSDGPSANLVAQASEILGDNFNPEKFLLTHATIVCSVDVESVPNTRLGSQLDNYGRRINRKWSDYRIKGDCDKFINNNHDAWERSVLLKSYQTFVGAHNFCEHVQIEDCGG